MNNIEKITYRSKLMIIEHDHLLKIANIPGANITAAQLGTIDDLIEQSKTLAKQLKTSSDDGEQLKQTTGITREKIHGLLETAWTHLTSRITVASKDTSNQIACSNLLESLNLLLKNPNLSSAEKTKLSDYKQQLSLGIRYSRIKTDGAPRLIASIENRVRPRPLEEAFQLIREYEQTLSKEVNRFVSANKISSNEFHHEVESAIEVVETRLEKTLERLIQRTESEIATSLALQDNGSDLVHMTKEDKKQHTEKAKAYDTGKRIRFFSPQELHLAQSSITSSQAVIPKKQPHNKFNRLSDQDKATLVKIQSILLPLAQDQTAHIYLQSKSNLPTLMAELAKTDPLDKEAFQHRYNLVGNLQNNYCDSNAALVSTAETLASLITYLSNEAKVDLGAMIELISDKDKTDSDCLKPLRCITMISEEVRDARKVTAAPIAALR